MLVGLDRIPSSCNGSTINVLLATRKDGDVPSRINPGLLEVILFHERARNEEVEEGDMRKVW